MVNKTYCDRCGLETDYYSHLLTMKSRSGHGYEFRWDLCGDCAKIDYNNLIGVSKEEKTK